MYVPEQCVSIDEELLLWKGNKRLHFGIKLFSLCDSTGYLWNLDIYLGKYAITNDTSKLSEKELGKSVVVVPKLRFELFGQGYHLHVDNS